MNDYVSRQAVIDYLMKNMNWYDEDDRMVDDWSEKEPIITELIKGVPTGWISVKERLPEQAGYRCLVSAEYGDGKRTVFTAFTGYGEPGWWTYESVYMEKVRESDNRVHHNYHITHWMPMPEPPEEEAT